MNHFVAAAVDAVGVAVGVAGCHLDAAAVDAGLMLSFIECGLSSLLIYASNNYEYV